MVDGEVPRFVVEALSMLTEPAPMRRGSVSVRYMRCSKPGCQCGKDPAAKHGPYISLTRTVGGKTRSRLVSAEKAEVLRRQVESGRDFRRRLETYWEACERWADMELGGKAVADEAAAKKGASKRASTRKSSGKSSD